MASLETLRRLFEIGRNERPAYLIGIAGIPGSGKSTLAAALAGQLPHAAVLPMDGYHLPRTQLDAEGLRRRGAPWTFDHHRFRDDLCALRLNREGAFPSFDHAVKDPVRDAIQIRRDHCPVIVEGLYLLLGEWDLGGLFDFTVFLDCDLETAGTRVAKRHLASGIAAGPADAQARWEFNDEPNARLILADGCRERADLVWNSGPGRLD